MVAVARKGQAPIAQIAKDFGISESFLHRWLNLADIDDGIRPGVTSQESAALREAKKRCGCWSRRMRSCAGRRRSSPGRSAQNGYPLVVDLAADAHSRCGDLPGAGLLEQAFYAWRKNPISRREYDDAHLINTAMDIHHNRAHENRSASLARGCRSCWR